MDSGSASHILGRRITLGMIPTEHLLGFAERSEVTRKTEQSPRERVFRMRRVRNHYQVGTA